MAASPSRGRSQRPGKAGSAAGRRERIGTDMAAGKEIRGKIKSVENTKKITKAMEMVAASKMRKAQDRMRSARPYSDKIRHIAANLAQANPEYTHPFLVKQSQAKTVGFIVVTTDKG